MRFRVLFGVLTLLGAASCDSSEGSGDDDGTASSTTSSTVGGSSGGAASEAASTSGIAPSGEADLIDLDAFVLVDATGDPFGDRPADTTCTLGFGFEDGLFEVDAEICLYGAFSQPSLVPLRAGDTIEAVIVHDALFSEDPEAVSHLGVAIGTEIGWEATLELPSDANFFRPTWMATEDMPAGTPIHFHVHNHGANTYRLVAITVTYA